MTNQPTAALLDPFPAPSQRLDFAYFQLHLALNGSPAERKAVGDPARLPRPWLPDTCTDPQLRRDLWAWLDAVTIWLNQEYTWDPDDLIPACWPAHPHLVREIAAVADQYRRARAALESTALEEWHRYTLPMFTDRMRRRCRQHCESNGHRTTPGYGRQQRHTTTEAAARQSLYDADIATLDASAPSPPPERSGPRLVVVDPNTGEILD